MTGYRLHAGRNAVNLVTGFVQARYQRKNRVVRFVNDVARQEGEDNMPRIRSERRGSHAVVARSQGLNSVAIRTEHREVGGVNVAYRLAEADKPTHRVRIGEGFALAADELNPRRTRVGKDSGMTYRRRFGCLAWVADCDCHRVAG